MQKSEKKLSKRLKNAQQSIDTLIDEKEILQNQLDLLNLKIAQSRGYQLENIRDALADSEIDLWHENFVNGEYVIAYELGYSLHQDVQSILPKVYFIFRTQELFILQYRL